MTICTTLNRIKAHHPCSEGWKELLEGLGKTRADDEPLPYERIVAINGIADALWACRAEPQYAREWRLYAVWCARQVEHLMADRRSKDALDVAERHANGEVTDEELAAAWEAACDAACGAAWVAACGAACDDACEAAWVAARGDASAAARDAQAARFIAVCNETEERAP